MSDIAPINTSPALRVRRVEIDASGLASADEARGRGGARTSDRVEISNVAQYLSQLKREPAERTDLINRVREEISSGTYLTDEKLDAAADQLLDDINFEL